MLDVSDLDKNKIMDRMGSDAEWWWCVVNIEPSAGGGKPAAKLQAHGDTDVKTMLDYLFDDQIQYGLIKVLGVDARGAVTR
jgi:hypothetical protein